MVRPPGQLAIGPACPLGCPASWINQSRAHHCPGLLPAQCQGPLAARDAPGKQPTNLSVKVASRTLWKGRRTAARVGRWGSCGQAVLQKAVLWALSPPPRCRPVPSADSGTSWALAGPHYRPYPPAPRSPSLAGSGCTQHFGTSTSPP